MTIFGHKHKDSGVEQNTMPNARNQQTGVGETDISRRANYGGAGIGSGALQDSQGMNNQQGFFDNNNAPIDPFANMSSGNATGIPPVGQMNSHLGHNASGGGAMAGMVEHAVGSMLGSQSLKARGLQKEQEADAFNQQSAELAEAERLEREALTRRERAVAHGAHPDNAQLGGGMAGGLRGGGL